MNISPEVIQISSRAPSLVQQSGALNNAEDQDLQLMVVQELINKTFN